MKIGVTGAHGTIGSQLVPFLKKEGYEVVLLPRRGANLKGLDVVINLAGTSIQGRFSKKKKQEIFKSRTETTKSLVESMKIEPPTLFISASAIGYYGNTGEELMDEASPAGSGFLADVCSAWEEEAKGAPCQVVLLRLGVVLTPSGGALKQMLPIFRLGLGAVLGRGSQWMSWVSIEDLLAIFLFCIKTRKLSGPVNAVSPRPITNKQFTLWLANKLHRPCMFTAPEWLLRLVLGEFADETLLASCKVNPKKLLEAGFIFKDVDVENVKIE